MITRMKLNTLLARKHLRGDEVGRMIGENFVEMFAGGTGFLNDGDVLAMRRSFATSQECGEVQRIGKTCQHLAQYVQEAEIAALRAERDLYRASGLIGLMAALGEDGLEDMGNWKKVRSLDVVIRLNLMCWQAYCTVIELASSAIRVDFTSLLEIPRKETLSAVAQYNQVLELVLSLMNQEICEATTMHSLDLDELQPTDEWREELTRDIASGIPEQWSENAMQPTFPTAALGGKVMANE